MGVESEAPLILGLQPAAMVDHVARVNASLLSLVPGESGGSFPVNTLNLSSPDDMYPTKTIAGGSVANTIRGLASGFGVSCGIIGAFGDDEQGNLFVNNMSSYGVSLSRLRMKRGHTAQADELTPEDFKGSKWLVMRYSAYNLEVIQEAIRIAKQEGLSVSLDLASFEMVRKFRVPLLQLLKSGNIDLCFANEDEAAELIRGEEVANPEAALEFLGKHCQWAVVTLGPNGCIVKHRNEIVRVPAIGEAKPVDATGAGDLFAGGFLYGLIKGLPVEKCCRVGACSGGAVIRTLGGEVSPENWQWVYKHMKTKGLPIPANNVI